MQFFDKNDNKNFVIRVPTKQGRRLFVYYRRYDKNEKLDTLMDSKKTMYQMFQNHLGKRDVNTEPQQKLGSINVKTFINPLTQKKEIAKPKTDEDVLDDIPTNRTLFVYNFDTEFDANQVKFWFKTVGKIRSVFVGKHKSKKSSGKHNSHVYFALVIYKNAKDLTVTVDHPQIFQERVAQALKSIGMKIDEDDKIKYQEDLIKNFAGEELTGNQNEFVNKMEEDGFVMVKDFTGGYDKFTRTAGKEDDEENKDELDYAPRKKKKTLVHDDFYRFQVKNNAAMKSMGYEHFKNFRNKNNDDVVGLKLNDLKKGFQSDIQKLNELRKKKAMEKNQDE